MNTTYVYSFRAHNAIGVATYLVIATDYESALAVCPSDKWEAMGASVRPPQMDVAERGVVWHGTKEDFKMVR